MNEFLQVIRNMGADYMFLTDLDSHRCATEAKTAVKGKYPGLEDDAVHVSKCEVESWYLSGLTKRTAALVGLDESAGVGDTEHVTKERFLALRPARYASDTAFRVEVLKHFQRASASRRNKSFARLAKKRLK